ncbi:MAG: tRNA (N6-isopentenyl adenosine(37)-C2)-methylthiotransferase MiaB [Bacteroides sp.]|jgi:tRNA-2-methylthio-N6-dimethylallyladenosine synthase|nr:tRNA (N6-isopentenyl adenosine(37)-C2)-methylthiotransferase MiaB [Bacteroides graminisolvens]MBP5978210.1 tRNA (N6-isopentenyl adenosine(37)-C2)-methylthiotransferase MiaB [Bacteroides sp.]MBP6247980.1 tRNA (N6-isopentenyl adenosine(37)-C2)-methylthiotransferase MiaB [Bacteroides sp.]MBP6980798.1 tRNA (N6-isopentenyl adenosine(37)-C2)-methylthiotransferase MiaB [Bacteroides sp.]MBP9495166.1 tRNA (N6-isopentenyl adenosine(37)-C2)-methylthiotransferase MiaB [Bacteroides sp.]MBP9719635.1 tRNA
MNELTGADFKSATVEDNKKLFIETYGCQMNVADSEVIASVMQMAGYSVAESLDEADAVFMNTCSIRDNAEQKILNRLEHFYALKKKKKHLIVGVLGCMAERVKDELIEKHHVDLVVGPDAYLTLPDLVAAVETGEKAINVELSTTETYREVIPSRICGNHISGFVSIMRGCNNFCTYCIVPYTRGRERSRDVSSILNEVRDLITKGYKEITLLGQNVNSYQFEDGERTVTFPMLLRIVAEAAPGARIRFTTSHPKDMSDETLQVIAEVPNVCKHIHLPVQSGSSRILKLMNRKYTREWYLERVQAIKRIIPDCGLTTDIFSGFHSETDEDHQLSLSLMEECGYDSAFMFKYSERPGTYASKKLVDDVPEEIKVARLNEIIALQNRLSLEANQKCVGKTYEVLVEGVSKRSREQLFGRTEQNKVVVFDRANHKIGDFVQVVITEASSATLKGEPLAV